MEQKTTERCKSAEKEIQPAQGQLADRVIRQISPDTGNGAKIMPHAHTQGRRHRLLSLLAAGAAALSIASLAGAAGPREVALEAAPSGHRLLPVTIDGEGPFVFILDTGATHTAIAAPVAALFGFQSDWALFDDVQALTTRFEAERFALQDLHLSGQDPIDLVSVIIPVTEDQPVTVAGLLGADAIRSPRYAIDFAAARLTLDAPAPRREDGEISPLGLLTAEADIRQSRRPIRVMLDSGSARTLINPRLAQRLASRHVIVNPVAVGGVDGRLQEDAEPAIVRNFRVGGLCIPAFSVLEADLDIFRHLGWQDEPAMILGMDLMQFARIGIDREAGTFEIDASGERFACGDRD